MGMSIERLLYLQAKSHLTSERKRLMDIGPQNVFNIEREKLKTFLDTHGVIKTGIDIDKEIDRLVYFSTPRQGERTTLLSEITDLTDIEYNSIDVCPGLKTEILDLNIEMLPSQYSEYYDVVLNYGTTEHILNQWNSFMVMHDALKVDGIIYHQLPMTGYLDHGYYCYTPLFFTDLARANDYVITDMFATEAGQTDLRALNFDVRSNERYMFPYSAEIEAGKTNFVNFNIHVVMRKTKSASFRCALEIATAHASADEGIMSTYREGGIDALGEIQKMLRATQSDCAQLREELGKERAALQRTQDDCARLRSELQEARGEISGLLNSTSWKVSAPVRRIGKLLR